MKFDKSILFFIILAVALLSTLGMNIKEGLTPESTTSTRKKYRQEMARRSGANAGADTITSIRPRAPTNYDNDDSTSTARATPARPRTPPSRPRRSAAGPTSPA